MKMCYKKRLKGCGLDSFCTGEGPMVGFCECIMNFDVRDRGLRISWLAKLFKSDYAL